MKTNKQTKNPKNKTKNQKPGHRECELFETTNEKQTYLFASESIYTRRYSNIYNQS